ncbi:ATP-binding cassette domain-containing protein [Candidatus Gracilibacteria bacterium]|nr:ATP-binding cassette domain-containing protein [Candidatus Gracilibacteria bacterium]
MLKFRNVSLSLAGQEVLKNLNFEIVSGELVAIVGASGAGKSSIFKLLISEQRPTLGTILLDQFSIGDLSFSSIQNYRRQIGIIFQDFRLLSQKTIFENVAFALEVCGEKKITEKVLELLKLVGLTQKQGAFPRELSGGERQRVSIARALVHDPKILIADEATGNLDPKNSLEIATIFQQLHEEKNLTILFATHDPILIEKLTPRVIRLKNGVIDLDKKACTVEEAFKGLL